MRVKGNGERWNRQAEKVGGSYRMGIGDCASSYGNVAHCGMAGQYH